MNSQNFLIPPEITSKLKVPQVINLVQQLPVNQRYTWASLVGVRKPTDLTTIVIHHDALSKASTARYNDIELASRIATSHINTKRNEKYGDPGFPYHLWIRNGRVYQCNDILPITYGVAANNGYTVHVCVSGDYFNGDKLTEADKQALVAVLIALKQALPAYKSIQGHGEITATNCPGYDPDDIRDAVASMEEYLSRFETWGDQLIKVSKLINEINWSNKNIAKGEKDHNAQIHMKKMLNIYEYMKSNNMLPPNAP